MDSNNQASNINIQIIQQCHNKVGKEDKEVNNSINLNNNNSNNHHNNHNNLSLIKDNFKLAKAILYHQINKTKTSSLNE